MAGRTDRSRRPSSFVGSLIVVHLPRLASSLRLPPGWVRSSAPRRRRPISRFRTFPSRRRVGATVFPREVPEVQASARSSSRSSHRGWGPWRILGPAALALPPQGDYRERRDQDSDARKDAEEQDRIVEKPG